MNRTVLLHLVVIVWFFFSGLAGLVYEIVWARYLALFLGSDAYAVMAVLATFMSGLALGNFTLGAVADRMRRPLVFFGCLELGIGLFALMFPAYFAVCRKVYFLLPRGLELGAGVVALKFAFSVLAILPPTILMGATLPALTKALTRSIGQLQSRVAVLYALNSLGAVAGCWVADFWWIPSVGLRQTVFLGASINLIVGFSAILVGLFVSATSNGRNQTDEGTDQTLSRHEVYLATVGIGLSGFTVMLYEVAWTRVLALSLGGTTHAFSLMLMAFISGIALGAIIVSRWRSLPSNLSTFGWLQLATACSLLVSMFSFDRLSFCFTWMANMLARRDGAYPFYEFLQILVCLAVSIVPLTCSGMTLPVISRIVTRQMSHLSYGVGKAFAANTFGAVLGTLCAGLWLMPWLGLARTFGVGIGVNVVLGIVLLARRRLMRRPVLWAPVPLLIIVSVLQAGWLFDDAWQNRFTLGLWRYQGWPQARQFFVTSRQSNEVKFFRDGATATVSVNRFQYKGTEQLVLKINGKPDASTAEDMSTQLLLGHAPLLLRPHSQSVLVIGLGSGVTCGAVSRHPSVKKIHAVEISREVIEAAVLFREYNHDVLSDSRARVFVDDARSLLQTTADRYDVIVSEPSNPWMAGVAGLFSQEFYRLCAQRLPPDGLMAQWFHVYEADEQMFHTVLATFASAFPHVSVWQTSKTDLLLVGSAQPREVDLAALATRFHQPSVQEDLRRIEMTRLPVFLACEVISAENGRHVPPPDTRLHSDFRPTLEYAAQRAFFRQESAEGWRRLDEKLTARPRSILAQYMSTHTLDGEDFEALARFYFAQGWLDANVFRSVLSRWREVSKTSVTPFVLSARLSRQSEPVGRAVAMEREAQRLAQVRDALRRSATTDPQGLQLYADVLLNSYRFERSVFFVPPSDHLEEVLQYLAKVDPQNRRLYLLQLAEIAWDREDDLRCLELGQLAFQPERSGRVKLSFSQDPSVARSVITRMIEIHWRAGRHEEAWDLCRQARDAGYIETPVRNQDPVLDMTYRKVKESRRVGT